MRRLLRVLVGKSRSEEPVRRITITGIVGNMGPSINYRGRGLSQLIAWRIDGGPIKKDSLAVFMEVGAQEAAREDFLKSFAAGSLVKISVSKELLELPSSNHAHADAILPPAQDDELFAAAAPILTPPPFEHPAIGRFEPHPRLPWNYIGSAQWAGKEVEIWLQERPPQADHTALRRKADNAAAILAREEFFAASLKSVLIEHLYPKWVALAKSANTPALTPEEWLEKLPVMAIYPSDGNLVEFQLDGIELFGPDETVIASALLSEGFADADLVG